MRIITGLYKGRHFEIPRTFKARPTTDFAKENIFNVLNSYIDFNGAAALDLFSGTGGISLELVSRGCSRVISVEQDRQHHAFIVQSLKSLHTNVCTPLRTDAFSFIKACKVGFDFIFADPPYSLDRLPEIPRMVMERGLLNDGGVFVFEHGKANDFSSLPWFVERRAYGSVNFSLFRKEGKAGG